MSDVAHPSLATSRGGPFFEAGNPRVHRNNVILLAERPTF